MGARQLVEIGLRIAKKLDFPFPLLCDTDRKIGLAYGAGDSESGIIGCDGLDGVNGGTCCYEHPGCRPEACVGDCDGGGEVTVNEIVNLVNIALGDTQPSACTNGVPAGAAVDIPLIIEAVNNVLSGCAGS